MIKSSRKEGEIRGGQNSRHRAGGERHLTVRRYRWRRPRKRVHPPKPKLGIRASAPNAIWHVDTTVVRLLDGTRAYLYAVIDNFSRKILAWRVSERFDPSSTLAVLLEAGKHEPPPTLVADGGVENRTKAVNELVESGALRRVLAQTEIAFSNSVIESWWRTIKHQWLYLNPLDTVPEIQTATWADPSLRMTVVRARKSQ